MPFYRPILLVIVSLILFVLLGLLYDDRIGFMLWSSNEVSPASKKAEHSLLRNETGRPNSTYENTSSHLSDLVGDVSKQETPPTITNETFVNQQQAIDAPSTDASKTTTASTAPPTIAWVIFTHFINKEERMERFIFPSLDTWLPKVFLVLSDMWQEDYMQWCEKDDRCDDRITTIFVDCGEGYAYEPTCCKLEKGLTRVLDEYPPFDWYMYSDDDCYWKTDFLQHILAPLPPDEPIALCPDGDILEESTGNIGTRIQAAGISETMYRVPSFARSCRGGVFLDVWVSFA